MSSEELVKDPVPVHGLTITEIQNLSNSCIQAKSQAYCPYSNFHVGASLLTGEGQIVVGANVENASYPVTICAERVALGTAVATHGIGKGAIKAVGVATDMEKPCSPCGMCRQALREFCDNHVPIFMHTKDGKYLVKTVGELLPLSFGPDSLPAPDRLPNYG